MEAAELKILVVEDDPDQSELLEAQLENDINYKFKLLQARDGIEAIKLLEEEPGIQIILTDNEMPKLKGQDFLQLVDNKCTPDFKPFVVMITGYASECIDNLTDFTNIHVFILEKPAYQRQLTVKLQMILGQLTKEFNFGDVSNG